MAHLEVEPKPSRPWWIWALLIVVLIALAALLFKKYNANSSGATEIRNAKVTAMAIDTRTPY